MNFSELKEKVRLLSANERLQLAAFLADLEEQDEPAFRAEFDKRMQAMGAGHKVSQEEFEALVRKLQ